MSTVREELEDYLKDDDDMAKMCLTRKREQTQAWAAAQRSTGGAPRNPHPPHQEWNRMTCPCQLRGLGWVGA